jgi:hypothetical protein
MDKDALLLFSMNMSILKKLTLENKLLPSRATIKPDACSSLPKTGWNRGPPSEAGYRVSKGELDPLLRQRKSERAVPVPRAF